MIFVTICPRFMFPISMKQKSVCSILNFKLFLFSATNTVPDICAHCAILPHLHLHPLWYTVQIFRLGQCSWVEEWFSVFCDFWKWTHCCRLAIFYKFNSKKKNCAWAAKISLSKSHCDLKNEHFLLTICKYLPFTSKNNRHKENLGKPFCLNFILGPQKWAKLFLCRSKKKL